jgi:hypothetical protein
MMDFFFVMVFVFMMIDGLSFLYNEVLPFLMIAFPL